MATAHGKELLRFSVACASKLSNNCFLCSFFLLSDHDINLLHCDTLLSVSWRVSYLCGTELWSLDAIWKVAILLWIVSWWIVRVELLGSAEKSVVASRYVFIHRKGIIINLIRHPKRQNFSRKLINLKNHYPDVNTFPNFSIKNNRFHFFNKKGINW